jgi:hypothetical protein
MGGGARSRRKPARTCGGPTAFRLNVVHNVVHSMLGMHQLLMRAWAPDSTEAAARVVLTNHHLEPGTEAFFTGWTQGHTRVARVCVIKRW